MDFARSFTFPFEDEEWVMKFLVGSLIALVLLPITFGLGIIVLWGYQVATIRAKIRGEQPELPTWSDFGGMLKDGVFVFLINVVYNIPVIIATILYVIVVLAVTAIGGEGEAAGIGITVIALCFTLFMLVWVLFVSLIQPVGVSRYADSENFGSAMQFGEVFGMLRSNFVGWLVAGVLWNLIILPFMSSIGVLLCGVGYAIGQFYGMVGAADAHAQAYLGSNGGEPNYQSLPDVPPTPEPMAPLEPAPVDDFPSLSEVTPAPSGGEFEATMVDMPSDDDK